MSSLRTHRPIHSGRIAATILAGLVLIGLLAGARAARVHVNVRSTAASPDGTSWAKAFPSVQEAVFFAQPGDEIWVAAGVYKERVTLKADMGFYGGFRGDETDRSQRGIADIKVNPTVLDSEGMGRVVTVPSTATGCVIEGFTIRHGATQEDGGGIYAEAGVRVQYNTLLDNLAAKGGGLYALTGTIRHNVIIGNRAADGAGIYVRSGPEIRHNIIRGNQATGRGGGIWLDDFGRIESNIIDANSAGSGGGIWSRNLDYTIVNNTIVANRAKTGGAVHVERYGFATMVNNIVAHNSSGLYDLGGSGPIHNNCFFDNGKDFESYNLFPDQVGKNGNVRVDPRFVDRINGDYHLRPESPCRNTGLNSTALASALDMDGEPRIQETVVDIGADETDGAPRASTARIARVRNDGNDGNDGATWETAKRTVQAAVDAVAATGGEVWIGQGTFAGPVTMAAFVGLYGGFQGTEVERSERRFTNRNTLDGGQAGPVVVIPREAAGAVVEGLTVRGGRAPAGGGILTWANGVEIARNTITGNASTSATEGGGGLYGYGGAPVIRDNTFSDNTAANRGGGIYLNGASVRVWNNTLVGNSALRGGGIAFTNDQMGVLTNNIIAKNSSAIYFPYDYAWNVTIRNNCLYSNGATPLEGLTDLMTTSGNITEDPLFVKPEVANYHLSADSPCINAGDGLSVAIGALDIDGGTRSQGGRVDIGADEWAAPAGLARAYVRPDGDDTNAGDSWAAAKRSVRAALRSVQSPSGEVWVSAGTYQATLVLPPGVGLYGGFSGTETERDERDPAANVTTLSGSYRGSTIHIGPEGTGDSPATVVSGFTIRNGSGTLAINNRFGGGVFVDRAAPVLSGNRITENTAYSGGGVYLQDSPAVIEGNVIERNTITMDGGGLFLDRSPARVHGNVIRLNKHQGYTYPGGQGGGILVYNGGGQITGNRIEANANTHGGGIGLQAAQARVAGNLIINHQGEGIGTEYATVELVNNTVADNSIALVTGNRTEGIIANNILAFNGAGIRADGVQLVPLVFRANCVYGNAQYNFQNMADPTGTDGNIALDPLFVDRAGGNYRLLPGSPATDTGDDTALTQGATDLDGVARPQGPHVDMGAYETPVSLAFGTGDVIAALRMAAGLSPASTAAVGRYDAGAEGASGGALDLLDAARLARKAAGLDANP